MRVADYLLQTLEHCGVRAVFGNPGTTEIPLVRMCEGRERLRYVVALSEVAAVPMADGYARAARSLGVVNLHVAPGPSATAWVRCTRPESRRRRCSC